MTLKKTFFFIIQYFKGLIISYLQLFSGEKQPIIDGDLMVADGDLLVVDGDLLVVTSGSFAIADAHSHF
jgi:hypothetical protein